MRRYTTLGVALLFLLVKDLRVQQPPVPTADSFVVYDMWGPVWEGLTADASLRVRKGNYERIFDQPRTNIRAWERAHVK
jgi:hypothetical protein